MASSAAAPNSMDLDLRTIWEDVLGVPVGDGDSFFELGGDSLAAARILTRVRERFGLSLTILDVFDAPTLAEFSAVLERSAT